ncbi:hypothetical protein BOX15_Mlig023746g2 [Macrostomum lignano]|uniref:Cyclin-like domain-containing protein n=1 Tax=Macrostomum lignano TaxID=282301 RepID=A0A267DG04_9PLAT|nr:hypothetical protein BOX15_Mlig023746g2 [Macrostomum lignano]
MSARSGITASNVVMNNSSGSTGGRCERRSRRKRMKKRSTPEIAADWSKGNKEARRSESQMFCHLAESPASSEDNSEIEIPHSTNVGVSPSLPKDFEENLEKLLDSELLYHPKADPLFRINAACEDKVDAILRNEAIFNLRFLHKFYNLAPECFAHAVNISDRFIMKIKVKPKYMACVATAAYLIACKMIEDPEDWPSPEKLVSVARCGGSPSDLERMEGIIRTKLGDPIVPPMELAVTPLHFLQLLQPLFPSAKSYQRAVGDLEICLCSVAVYSFRPAVLALCIAGRYLDDCDYAAIAFMKKRLEVSDSDLSVCSAHLEVESRRVQNRSPAPRTLVWQLSRRTISNLQKPSAAAQASLLDPIREDWLEEDNLDIGRLFD